MATIMNETERNPMTSILENEKVKRECDEIRRCLTRLEEMFQPSSEKKECAHSWVAHCETCGKDQELKLSCPMRGTPDVVQPTPTSEEVRQGTSGGVYCTPESPCRKYPDCKCEIYPSELLKPCCAYHADHPQSKGKCSEDIEPEKCACRGAFGCDDPAQCKCHIHAPGPAIEAKINAFMNVWVERGTHDKARQSLLQLVELARRSDR